MLIERVIEWGVVSIVVAGFLYAFFSLTLDSATFFALGM
jgi:hypothetical protein